MSNREGNKKIRAARRGARSEERGARSEERRDPSGIRKKVRVGSLSGGIRKKTDSWVRSFGSWVSRKLVRARARLETSKSRGVAQKDSDIRTHTKKVPKRIRPQTPDSRLPD